MFIIEKNNILSIDNRFVRYLKEYKGAVVTLTLRPNLDTEELTVKIRMKNLPFENEVLFKLAKLSFKRGTEHNGLGLDFDFKQPFSSEEDKVEALEFIQMALKGIEEILVRWLMSDGICFLLKQDSSENMHYMVEMQYQSLKNKGELPEELTEFEIKQAIEEQLSQFYCEHLLEFEELEPLMSIATMTATSASNTNSCKLNE